MPSGKRSKQQRREATVVAAKPPPVRSKGAPRGARRASPRALAIGGGVLALIVVGVVLAFVFARGNSSGLPAGTPTIGRLDVNSLPGAGDIDALYKGIPQKGLYLGSAFAPVQMVMYIDLQCPRCQEFEVSSMPTIVRKYVRTGKVRIQEKPWAFIGPDSVRGQAAAVAASLQNKEFQFAGVLYDNQGTENTGWLTDPMLAQIAASVPGLNVKTLFADRNSGTVKNQVNAIDAAALVDKVSGTPTIFVGKSGTKPKSVGPSGYVPTLQQVETAITNALGG